MTALVWCPKGEMCTHEPDDSVWQSVHYTKTASKMLLEYWVREQRTPEMDLPEGYTWVSDTVVLHVGPAIDFSPYPRHIVAFTRGVVEI